MSKLGKADIDKAADVAWGLTKTFNPFLAISEVLYQAVMTSRAESDPAKLKLDAERAELHAKIEQAAARTAQELAIARRIDDAEEVEIEEYYEGAGEGSAGIKCDGKSVSGSLSGAARQVTKRVYRFKGWRPGTVEPDAEAVQRLSSLGD